MIHKLNSGYWQRGLIGIALLATGVAGAGLLSENDTGTAEPQDHSHHLAQQGAVPEQSSVDPGQTQYTCSMHPHVRSNDPNSECPICGMALVPVSEGTATPDEESSSGHHNHHMEPQEATPQQSSVALGQPQYTCSMHPHVRSNDPNGECPICGMALIPVSDDQAGAQHNGDAPSLRLSERALALSSVRVAPAQVRQVSAPIHLPGRIDYDETRHRVIAARWAGRLERLHVNETGTRVEAGDPLVELYSPDLVSAQQELVQAAQRLPAAGTAASGGSARAVYKAIRNKLRLLGVSSKQIDAIEERNQARDQLPIYAPMGGVVLVRHRSEGEYVDIGDPLYTMADLSEVWALLEAYETDLPLLAIGQRVTLQLDGLPGDPLEGRITFIDPRVDERRRTTQVRVELDNAAGRLKPGMLVHGQVHAEQPPALTIPASAPLLTGERALVYVQDPEDVQRFSAREVTLGPRLGDHYLVRRGLSEGELVVTNGAFRIDSELQIRGMPSMMSPESGSGGPLDHNHGDSDDRSGSGGAHE